MSKSRLREKTGRFLMVDIQIRGADGLAGAYGIGPFGLSYSVSGGTNGVQVQFQIAAFDLAVKGTYSSGYKDDAGNFSIQAGAGGVIGDGQGITYFAGGGYSSQKGLIESASLSSSADGPNVSYSTTIPITLLPPGDKFCRGDRSPGSCRAWSGRPGWRHLAWAAAASRLQARSEPSRCRAEKLRRGAQGARRSRERAIRGS